MSILDVLGLTTADEIDPSRSLSVEDLDLGPEASQEALRLAQAGPANSPTVIEARPLHTAFYWSLSHRGSPIGEAFGFPRQASSLPTAAEVALVRALHGATSDQVTSLCSGGHLIVVGRDDSLDQLLPLLSALHEPQCGNSILWGSFSNIDVFAPEQITNVAVKCFYGSVCATPIKFRFLELYRVMEARFLREVKEGLLASFPTEPKRSLENALSALKSEAVQLSRLAETKKSHFEMIYHAIHDVAGSNQLAAALMRKLSEQPTETKSPEWKGGSALTYFLRCAIVHAGQKDMIYEAYPDGDILVEAIMEYVEEASLALAGLELT